MKKLLLMASVISLLTYLEASCEHTTQRERESLPDSEMIYGITLNTLADFEQSLDSIKSFSKPVATRIVFDDIPAEDYLFALKELSQHSMVMGGLFDSVYIKRYSYERYKERVDYYLNVLGKYVSIWEIGNEVNGEWTGNPKNVAKKTLYAYQQAKQRNYLTSLTLYYNDFQKNNGCWEYPKEKKREWIRNYLDKEIIQGIDYLLISYYEEDCDGYQPSVAEWQALFEEVGNIFPNAELGFGEVGSTDKAKQASYLKRYYTLPINHPRYMGGFFWWYGKQDMVPKSKPLWKVLDNILEQL